MIGDFNKVIERKSIQHSGATLRSSTESLRSSLFCQKLGGKPRTMVTDTSSNKSDLNSEKTLDLVSLINKLDEKTSSTNHQISSPFAQNAKNDSHLNITLGNLTKRS